MNARGPGDLVLRGEVFFTRTERSLGQKGQRMLCKRCPHLVRHGSANSSGEIVFSHSCGLLIKADTLEAGVDSLKKPGRKPTKKPEKIERKIEVKPPNSSHDCTQYPFPDVFDYLECDVYQSTFKGGNRKYDVVPTKDFQYSEVLSTSNITDMELL